MRGRPRRWTDNLLSICSWKKTTPPEMDGNDSADCPMGRWMPRGFQEEGHQVAGLGLTIQGQRLAGPAIPSCGWLKDLGSSSGNSREGEEDSCSQVGGENRKSIVVSGTGRRSWAGSQEHLAIGSHNHCRPPDWEMLRDTRSKCQRKCHQMTSSPLLAEGLSKRKGTEGVKPRGWMEVQWCSG